MAYVIKRYSNRKLYDTQESRYVTLQEIEEMVRAGRDVSVVDAGSGDDLTSITLAQILLENERSRRSTLSPAFLRQLVKAGPEAGPRPARAGDGEAERLREEVTALRERLRALEERLERRRGEAR